MGGGKKRKDFHFSNYFTSFNIKEVLIKQLTNVRQLEIYHIWLDSSHWEESPFYRILGDCFCRTQVLRMWWRYINVYIDLDYKVVEWIGLPLSIGYAHSAQLWSVWVACSSDSRGLDSSAFLQNVLNAAARNTILECFISDSKLFRTFSHTILNQIFMSVLL